MSEHKSLAAAMLAVQADRPQIKKNKVNPHFKNKYADLDGVTDAILPVLTAHGIVWTAKAVTVDGEWALDYKAVHAATGEADGGILKLALAKGDMQGLGSAITYARRYAVQAVFNLVADEDDDGNAASQPRSNGNARQAPTGPLVSPEAIVELQAAAKANRRTVAQIAVAFGACGLSMDRTVEPEHMFDNVPAAKAAELTAALAGGAS
jgi:hypothetical protein